jgi:hypothetical protein
MHAGQRAEGVIFVTWYMLVQCKVARARARGIAVADNRFQIWGGVDDRILWLSFAQQKTQYFPHFFSPTIPAIQSQLAT